MNLVQLNPSIKGLTILVAILLLALIYDPITPLFYLIFVIIVTWIFGKVSIKKWLLLFSPFLLIALSYVWTTMLFPRNMDGVAPTALWSIGALDITQEGLYTGLSLGLRVLDFAALSLLFVLTTDPTRLMFSLMQQCKLPPKLAYGILAGYRFLPLMQEELRILQAAHRIRGVGRAKGLKERVKQIGRYAIPLLASAIRKSERVALAMESKGFTGKKQRVFYCQLKVSPMDWFFFSLMIVMLILFMVISWYFGFLRLYRGEI